MAAAFSALVAIWGAPASAAGDSELLVSTLSGPVQGHRHASVRRFLGIPYAQPPVGAMRWRRPVPVRAWEGVRRADGFGSACVQIGNFYASDDPETFGQVFGDEDCLYLNVWAPDDERVMRPVVVFIHGGSGVSGAASLPAYEASRLTRELGAVVVTINYRLGFLGHIHLDSLRVGEPETDSGSFSLLDQICALRWVQDNIAAFGGDPDEVTVAGHSAGAIHVWALLQSRLATGLFQRAVILSGLPMTSSSPDLRERSNRFIHRLEAILAAEGAEPLPQQSAARAARLRALPAGLLVEAGRDLRNMPLGRDGFVLPEAGPKPRIANAVPVLMGNTANEASMLLLTGYSHVSRDDFWRLVNEADYDALGVRDFFGLLEWWRFRVAVALFNWGAEKKLAASADRLADAGVPVFRYRFAWQGLPQPWKKILGAYHGLDVSVIFGDFRALTPNFARFSWRSAERETLEGLHARMVRALRGFIEHGDPARYDTAPGWSDWRQGRAVTVIDETGRES